MQHSSWGVQGKADIHVHTKYSGVHRLGVVRFPESVSNPADVVLKARSVGMNVLCITDHNSTAGAMKAKAESKDVKDIEGVGGEEISTADGEVIGLFLNEEIPAGLSIEESIDRIRAQDGLVIAPHPFSLHCPALGERIEGLDLDGIEVLNGGHRDEYANAKAAEVGKSGKWAKMGGSDAHYLPVVGSAYTTFNGSTAEELRREILAKRTDGAGEVIPMDKAIAWSMTVIVHSDALILRSFLDLDRDKRDDPIVNKVYAMKLGQKLGALVGSFVYLLPPVPFLAGMASEKLFHRWAAQVEAGIDRIGKLGPFLLP